MKTLKLSLIFVVLFAFVFVESTNPLTSLFGKSHDEKGEDEKNAAATTTTTTAKTVQEATTENPKSSCGGLKGFLHICDKSEPTEPPKNIKTRSVSEDDSDSDSDSDESDSNESAEGEDKQKETKKDNDDGNEEEGDVENKKNDLEKENVSEEMGDEKEPIATSSTEGTISKRNVEEVEKAEVPPNPAKFYSVPELLLEKRQINDYSSESDSSESEQFRKVKRDCRDKDGEYWKDCRKKRELVPSIPDRIKKNKLSTSVPNTK